jgi:imidazolonepropionase-like amidohydrolase
VLAIRAARLFDGDNASMVERPVVLVEDGRVVEVNSGGPVPERADVVDLGDATLLPGLVDAHQHLVFDGSPDPVSRLAARNDDEVLDGMRAAARTALAAGITTVRDLGDRDYLALRLRGELSGDPSAGPTLLAAGPPITTGRGHCWYLGGEAEGVEGVRAAVREHIERGVDVIKVMASGGELTPGTRSWQPQYTMDELRAIVDEAHRHGRPVTAHAHAAAAIANAIAAGCDGVEHCSFMTETTAEAQPDVIDALVRSGVVVSATVGLAPGTTPPPRILALISALSAVFNRMRESGVRLICSSDAGIGPTKPHDVLPYSAAMMYHELGYSTVDALRAVTSGPADACGLAGRKGRLSPGHDADILAVGGDPLADIAALTDVSAVFHSGVRVR